MSKTKSILSLVSISLLAMTLVSVRPVRAPDGTVEIDAVFVGPDGTEIAYSMHFSWTEDEDYYQYVSPVTLETHTTSEYCIDCAATVWIDWSDTTEHYRLRSLKVLDGKLNLDFMTGTWDAIPGPSEWPDSENPRLVFGFQDHIGQNVRLRAYYERAGPKIDKLRMKTIKNPDDQLIAMQTEEGVVLTDLIRTGDIEKLDSDGFTITSAPGFHMGHIGINLRPDRDYLPPSYPPVCNPDAAHVLSDVNFRHALFHLYNQEEIVSSIYGYPATAIQSLVPPAQGGWYNPDVPLHLYNPGNKTDTAEYNPATGENEDACSILRYGGYLYDPTLDNWVTPYDIDGDGIPGTNHPDRPLVATDLDDDVPPINLFLPSYEVNPRDAMHGEAFIQDTKGYGLTSIDSLIIESTHWMEWYVEIGMFDMYMAFWSVGRFPDHLETMCHSDHDVALNPHDGNLAGCNDPTLDDAVRTMITSLDYSEKLDATHLAQDILYNESYPLAAFAYMPTYSRNYFNAFNPDLRSIMNSPGYGSDNGWTYMNMRWAPGTERYESDETVIEWITGEEPELLNPCSASTVYAWDIIGKTQDGLIDVNPYTHEDTPSLAESWMIVGDSPVPGQMEVIFYLRKDVFWQDGKPFTAHDVEFNWEFLRDNAIPRYVGMWQFLIDVAVIDDYTVKAIMSTTSQFLIYDLAGTAALLPPQVWWWLDGKPLATIMEYDPGSNTTSTGYPWFGVGTGFPNNQLFGTGPFVFEEYDPLALVSELHQFGGYWLTTNEIVDMKDEMFHKIGDVDRDGEIAILDLARQGLAYFAWPPDPLYDIDADVNCDGIVDMRDITLTALHYGEQKEYPEP